MKKKLIAFLFLFLVAVVFHLPQGDDSDLWWHIRYGQIFLENGTLTLDHSVFSWTPATNEWKYVTWLGSSVFYLLYQIGYMPVFFLLNIAILLVIFYLYRKYLQSLGEVIELSNILGLLLFVLVITPMLFKPEIFSFLFFALCGYLYFLSRTSDKAYFFWFPPLFLVWVNTHGVFIFGYLLITVLFLGEVLTFLIRHGEAMPSTSLKYFFYSVVLSGAALCVNPYGIGYLTYLFEALRSPAYTQYFEGMIAYTSLWSYLLPGNSAVRISAGAWYLVFMFVMFLIAYLYSYRKGKNLYLPILLSNCIIFLLSMQHARSAFLYPTLWLFSTAFLLRGGFEKIMPRRWQPLLLVLIVALSLLHIKTTMTIYHQKTWFGINYVEWVPQAEADFIKNNKLPGPLFNDYLSGGFLIWRLYPDYKVFIDPRYGPYTKDMLADWATIRKNLNSVTFKTIVDKYQFRSALVHYREEPLLDQFLSSLEWKLVYFGNNAAVFVKKPFMTGLALQQSAESLGFERFSKLSDPTSLVGIFNMYSSQASIADLQAIRAIYKKNVFKYYIFRDAQLAAMGNVIRYHHQMLKATR